MSEKRAVVRRVTLSFVVGLVALLLIQLLQAGFPGHQASSRPPIGTQGNRGLTVDSSPAGSGANLFGTRSSYMWNGQRVGANILERTLAVTNASSLNITWSKRLPGAIMGSLVAANGTVYVGSWGGTLTGGSDFYAMNASNGNFSSTYTGWTSDPKLGYPTYSTCANGSGSYGNNPKYFGVTSTPTIANGKLYLNGGNTSFYEIYESNGSIARQVDVGNNSTVNGSHLWRYQYDWGSPLIYKGYAYVGTSALCEDDNEPNTPSGSLKYVQGQLLMINITTGCIAHWFNVTRGAYGWNGIPGHANSTSPDVGGSI